MIILPRTYATVPEIPVQAITGNAHPVNNSAPINIFFIIVKTFSLKNNNVL